ncbi:MAG: hypothetical protein SGI74_03970 [Oligoflexia bacterium]|nr:hypothetical protein [Oligoflexia bacterium]
MAKTTDVVICGSGFRGLWLASELVKIGWSVTWIQLHRTPSNKREGGFVFDDWAWQVGPAHQNSKLVKATQEFINDVIKPELQNIAVQIITPLGPFEFTGGAQKRCFKKFFKDTALELEEFLLNVDSAQKMESVKGSQLIFAYVHKVFKFPLGKRWVLEWLGSLRRPRTVGTFDWITKWGGDILNPNLGFWLLQDSLTAITERAMTWAERKGVTVMRNAKIVDVGVEGRSITGVEIQGAEGYMPCRYLILSASHQTISQKLDNFSKNIKSQLKAGDDKFVWARCGFFMKPHSKPEGLLAFSSYVIDPNMPLKEANMGLLKWRVTNDGDYLTVWVCIPNSEIMRRSYLKNLLCEIQKHLESLFPWFSKQLSAVLPFEEYFQTQDLSHDDLAVVFDESCAFAKHTTRLKNVWLGGPVYDRGLELLSRLATEMRLLTQLSEVKQKESKRDRALYAPRNGQNLDNSKQI